MVAGLVVATVVAGAADIWQLKLIKHIQNGGRVSFATANDSDDLFQGAHQWQLVFELAVFGFFIWWFRRAVSNLPSLGAIKLSFGTRWAVGGWFVPIMSFWRPKQVMDQIWRASDPGLPPIEQDSWRDVPVWFLVHWWWGLWLGVPVLTGIAGAAREAAQTIDDLDGPTWFVLITDAAMLVLAVVVATVGVSVTNRQRAADNRFEEPASFESVPDDGHGPNPSPR